MTDIPPFLQKEDYRFIKIPKASKKPIENVWQKINNYEYNNPILQDWLKQGNNYGVVCGYGKLRGIDIDTKNINYQEAIKFIESRTATFSVKTGSGGRHFYFITDYCTNHGLANGIGEIRCGGEEGQQVIGPGSLHPSGNHYEIAHHVPIQHINSENFKALFEKYMIDNYQNSDSQNSKKDNSRSGTEMREIIKLINKKLGKEDIWKRMEVYAKWSAATESYRLITYEKAITYIDGQKEKKRREQEEYVKEIDNELIGQIRTHFITKKYLEMVDCFIRHCPIIYDENCLWWIWDTETKRYKLTDETNILNALLAVLDNDDLINYKNKILSTIQLQARKYAPTPMPESWIQFKNNIVDIDTGETFATSHEYFSVNPIPWDLGKSEETPIIDALFESWVGKEYVETLYEIIAYCLLPSYPMAKIFCFVGVGSNGKSKFLTITRTLLGTYNSTSSDLDVLLENRFESARLYKKLVCFMGETNFNVISKTSKLKELTGGDLASYEFKNGKLFNDVNYAKFLISTNSLPMTTDSSDGWMRRWIIIDFPNKFDGTVDVLKTIPEVEYNNLCRKALNKLQKLLQTFKFSNEGTIEDKRHCFEEHSNPISKFIAERIEFTENFDSDIISKYQFKKEMMVWGRSRGYRELSNQDINMMMDSLNVFVGTREFNKRNEKGEVVERRTYDVWKGLKWKTAPVVVTPKLVVVEEEVVDVPKFDAWHKCKICGDSVLCTIKGGVPLCQKCYF